MGRRLNNIKGNISFAIAILTGITTGLFIVALYLVVGAAVGLALVKLVS